MAEDGSVIGPPPGCGAGLGVEVVPIDRPEVQTTTSSGTVGQLTDTSGVAGENLATNTLDQRIKLMTWMGISGYLVAISGGVVFYLGAARLARYDEDTSSTDKGEAGSSERAAFVSGFAAGQGMFYGGIAGFVVGAGLGLWATVRGKKLRNERTTRLAGIGVSPLPGGGALAGARWRF